MFHIKLKPIVLLSALSLSTSVYATNGYQLIGVGSYQKGLAGAVTAFPGSAMTAVTNPAGIARIGNRADFSMEAFMPERSVDFTQPLGGNSAESGVDMYGVPSIGWSAPTSEGSDVYFGGGMYGTSGMGVDYAVTDMGMGMTWNGYSNLTFWQMAPVFAWNVDEDLSLGVSLNIDYQSVALSQNVTGAFASNMDLSRSASGFGFGLSFGLLYDASDDLTLGFSYKSKQNFSPMEYQLRDSDVELPGLANTPDGTYELDLDFPQQAAFGIAYSASEALTISADIKWINWSDTMTSLQIIGPGDSIPYQSGWDDQTIYAVGVSIELSETFTLLAGYNYAKSPIDSEDVMNNLILPAVVETHYTIGGSYVINEHWDMAFHYMYVSDKVVIADASTGFTGAKTSLSESSLGVNIGYRF